MLRSTRVTSPRVFRFACAFSSRKTAHELSERTPEWCFCLFMWTLLALGGLAAPVMNRLVAVRTGAAWSNSSMQQSYMRVAIGMARAAVRVGGAPYGALIVSWILTSSEWWRWAETTLCTIPSGMVRWLPLPTRVSNGEHSIKLLPALSCTPLPSRVQCACRQLRGAGSGG